MNATTIIWTVVIFFVTLALAQVIVFDLSEKTKYGFNPHTVIAYLGMGAAFYALFIEGETLMFIVIGIVAVGAVLIKLRKKLPWVRWRSWW